MHRAQVLRDLGERRILHNIIEDFFPPAPGVLVPIGDDAAVVSLPHTDDAIVLTTDPCPVPVAWLLGEKDYYLFGWYSVLINASDLAAMGATPTGVLLAVNARDDMLLDDFKRFLTGAADAASEFACPVLGGNLRDSNEFSCVGTAIGMCKRDHILQRAGANEGDLVVVIGDMGLFASGVIARIQGIGLTEPERIKAEQHLLRPMARVREGQALASERLATSCIDSSDGLVNCFHEIALKSKVDIYLDFSRVACESVVSKVATKSGVDPRKLLLMWGDWELVCTVPPSRLEHLDKAMKRLRTSYSVVGEARLGTGKVLIKNGSSYQRLDFVDNERFSASSYFKYSLEHVFDLNAIRLTGQ
jgi:thiamine-monophosphate kinase